jgi:hypothetical protein
MPQVTSADIKPRIIEPCEAGTIKRYASLESKLLAMGDYEIMELTEEMIKSFHPLSEEARSDSAIRSHYERYRNNLCFHSVAIKMFPATFGSQRKMMLFLWKVPLDQEKRTEMDNDRTATQWD